MNRFCNELLTAGLLLALLLTGFATRVQAQDAAEENSTRVTLGGTSGTPGNGVVVPVYFTPQRGVAVGRLHLEVTYVSVNMKFSKLDKGIAAELGGVDVAIEVQEGKNDKNLATQTLVINASFLEPQPPPTGIPSGLLAYITLNISDEGRPASISMTPTVEGTLVSGEPVPNLRAIPAQVDVLAPGTQPLISCFFFTH